LATATISTTENHYEGMFLLDSGKFAANPESYSNHIVELLEKAGATVVAHRPWQDGKLAYEVVGHRKGLHYLSYFRMDGSRLTGLARSVKLSDQVIRHLVIKHPPVLFDAMVAALDGGESAAAATETETRPTKKDDGATKSDNKNDAAKNDAAKTATDGDGSGGEDENDGEDK